MVYKILFSYYGQLLLLLLLCSHPVMSSSFATPWTTAHQAPLSMGFPGQEYWSGLPFPSPHNQCVSTQSEAEHPG